MALAVRVFLNRRLDGICEVDSLAIDTAAQSARLRIELHGERAPVEITIKQYLIQTYDEGVRVTLVDANASRPWVDNGLRAFVIGRPLVIPARAAFALKMLA